MRRASAAGFSWPLPEGLDDTALEAALFPPPPPSRVRRPEPGLGRCPPGASAPQGRDVALLWLEYRAVHPNGYQYSWFCERYKAWGGQLDVVMRQVYRAGEKAFVDYAGSEVPGGGPGHRRGARRHGLRRRLGHLGHRLHPRLKSRALPTGPRRRGRSSDRSRVYYGTLTDLIDSLEKRPRRPAGSTAASRNPHPPGTPKSLTRSATSRLPGARRHPVLPARQPPLRACLDRRHLEQGLRAVGRVPARLRSWPPRCWTGCFHRCHMVNIRATDCRMRRHVQLSKGHPPNRRPGGLRGARRGAPDQGHDGCPNSIGSPRSGRSAPLARAPEKWANVNVRSGPFRWPLTPYATKRKECVVSTVPLGNGVGLARPAASSLR